MQELIVTHSLSLESNLAQVKESIAHEIAKYDVVVTEDRLAEAKELMATFNKQKKAFSDQCKAFLSAISAPIDEFKAGQKEIESMYDDGRNKIKTQVDSFEAHKIESIKVLLSQLRDNACAEKGINPSSITIDDLVKLTAVNVNKSGYTVSKATAETIAQRIQSVENEMLRAKLAAEEKAKHEREIAELARAEAEEKARQREAYLIAKAERDKAEAVAQATRQAQQQQQQSTLAPIPVLPAANEPTNIAHVVLNGKATFVITATFEVEADANIDTSKIVNKFNSVFANAGITSLKTINVAHKTNLAKAA
jgi:hypothetical protein